MRARPAHPTKYRALAETLATALHEGRYPPGTQITQPTVSAREAEVWTLTVEGVEQLDLPGGQLEALRLVRQPRRPYDQRIEVWLARQLHWLPARIRITQANGDFVDQRWRGSEPVAP